MSLFLSPVKAGVFAAGLPFPVPEILEFEALGDSDGPRVDEAAAGAILGLF